jgi:histidinol-phosphate phosphatase family protein
LKLVFLDRDGVINKFPGKGLYVTTLQSLELLPSSAAAIRLLNEAGFETVVISNQGCVSRGFMTEEALYRLTDHLKAQLAEERARLDRVFYCLHQTADNCECKKPKTGLLKKALEGRDGDVSSVYFVGDSREDVEAGRAAGLKTILVLSGRSSAEDVKEFPVKPDYVKKDLMEAALWILRRES